MTEPPVKILLVDDQPGNLLAVEATLASPEYHLVTATSGEAALRQLLQHDFALIVLDVHMPGLDGFETAGLIKARERSQHIPIIFLTGTGEQSVFTGYAVGAVDYLVKPVNPAILKAKVEVFASLYRYKQHLAILNETLEQRVAEQTATLRAEIAERQRVEEAQARLVAILEATTDFISVADAQGHALYLNAGGRKMLGIGEDEDLTGFPIADGHPEWARKLVLSEGIPVAIPNGVWTGETALLSRDGREIPVSQVILAHKAPDGTVQFLSTIARDITERKRFEVRLEATVEDRTRELQDANRQLAEASRHKSEFLANMSHELRTPLNSVIGFSELLLDRTVGALNEKQTRFLTNIQNSGKHLVQLISDILDLSKVEAGKVVLQVEPLPVAMTLEDILVIGRGLAHKKRQTVEIQIDPDLPPLQADPVRFKQILFNLLSNAIKFTPDGGSVTVTAKRVRGAESGVRSGIDSTSHVARRTSDPGEFIEIAVADTGIGIKADDLPRLFQEFMRLEAAATKRYEGTGLGLALTRRLVELHGGRIWAESAGEGRGSTFTLVLPFNGPGEARES